ncbi:MAG: nucleotidyltransferase domain-containing protein [Acidobacteriota bacterium]|nr:nucleotidyltransferase domain-containing protein [Acidobacteriota bacterium]
MRCDHPTLKTLCQHFKLDALHVFGSRAGEVVESLRLSRKLDPRHSSDVDIGVLPNADYPIGVDDRVGLTGAFEELLGVSRVNVVVLPSASSYLALDVVSGARLCCFNPIREAEYQPPHELDPICTERIPDITDATNTMTAWVREHPELVDRSL